MSSSNSARLFDPAIVRRAIRESFLKLHPRQLVANPVMLVVAVGSVVTSLAVVIGIMESAGSHELRFAIAVSVVLWLTVLFANFAESVAEGRGKAHAEALRSNRSLVTAHRLRPKNGSPFSPTSPCDDVDSSTLRVGDVVLVRVDEIIPADGEAIAGVASVDESAITGESAPVIRESGGDRSAVTGGTRVVSDWLVVRVTANPGEAFLDRMITMVEGAKRRKTPNEVALELLLVALTLVFLLAVATLYPYSVFAVASTGRGSPVPIVMLVALLVCLIPTTIGALLSAIGIAGMDRLMRANVIATSGRAVEAAGDVDVLLLDKTGTITYGNRQAAEFVPAPGVKLEELVSAAFAASALDETPEGRSIVKLAVDTLGREPQAEADAVFIPFSALTRMSGVDVAGRIIRKGAADAVARLIEARGTVMPAAVLAAVERVAREGATPLVVSSDGRVLGVISLKDVVKPGIRERFLQMRQAGIKTIMVTGDNRLTAAAIAAEAGVDDFLAEATPENKLALIRSYQAKGHMVAMTGDGSNDAPALAQADVAVAMNTGTQAAKEAGNMVDLDSNPTKLLSVVEVGKQLLMTRGALTTFSIANDVAKYFAIVPAAFVGIYPGLAALNVMQLSSPSTAVLSATIFNAFIILALIPFALMGVPYRPAAASELLRRNTLIYGLGGVVLPFPCIKVIDTVLASCGVV